MLKKSLWAEITISGFVYFLTLFFLILTFMGVKDLFFLGNLKDFMLYLSIGAVAFSYILGILAHRILVVFYYCFCFIIGIVFHKQKLKEKWITAHTFKSNFIKVYQLGTDRLHRELDFQFSLLSMIGSLSLGFILLGINLGIWLWNSIYSDYTLLFTIFFIIMGLLSLIVAFGQRKLYYILRDLSFEQIDEYNDLKKKK
jgi:hypothetical protein